MEEEAEAQSRVREEEASGREEEDLAVEDVDVAASDEEEAEGGAVVATVEGTAMVTATVEGRRTEVTAAADGAGSDVGELGWAEEGVKTEEEASEVVVTAAAEVGEAGGVLLPVESDDGRVSEEGEEAVEKELKELPARAVGEV